MVLTPQIIINLHIWQSGGGGGAVECSSVARPGEAASRVEGSQSGERLD